MHTPARLYDQCHEIGLAPGQTVMVHASLRAVGPILGGPDVLIDAIMRSVAPDGTMMVYVGTQTPFDDVGRGLFSPEEEALILEHCSDPDEVTLLHYAENIAPIADKKTVKLKLPLLIDGVRRWTEIEECNSSTGIRDWPDRFFAEIVGEFLKTAHVCAGRIGNAASHLIDARALVDFAIPIMVETAKRIDTGEV